MRAAQSQAKGLENQDVANAAGYGSSAADVNSALEPFLTRELTAPSGFSQQDLTAMQTAGEAGAGGVTGGIQSKLNQEAAASGNASGFAAAGDELARERGKAAASAGENIAAQNAEVKQKQQQSAAEGLRGLYGTDVGAQMQSMGLGNEAINTEINAGKSGWLQNMLAIINTLKPGVSGGGDSGISWSAGG